MREEISGIYTITNTVDNKIYVGCTYNIHTRLGQHRGDLRGNRHKNHHLQRAFNKYGESCFLFEELEQCEEQFLCSQENYWCNMLDTHNPKYGYNIKPTDPNGTPRMAEESKKRLSIAHKELQKLRGNLLQFNLKGDFIKEWYIIDELATYLKVTVYSINSHITGIKQGMNTCGGFLFARSKDYKEGDILKCNYFKNRKPFYQYNLEGELLNTFRTKGEAEKETECHHSNIETSMRYSQKGMKRTTKGFIWSEEFLSKEQVLLLGRKPYKKNRVKNKQNK